LSLSSCNPTLATYGKDKKVTREDLMKWINGQYPGREDFILSKLNYQYNIVREMVIMDLVETESQSNTLFNQDEFKKKWLIEQKFLEFKKYQSLSQKYQNQITDQAKKNDNFKEEVVKASHILIKVERNKRQGKKNTVLTQTELEKEYDKALKKVREALREAKAGKDFSALAKKYSEDSSKDKGGDIGYFTRFNMMVEPFSKAAFEMKVGEVSEPVKSQYGYHIIKVLDKKTATPQNIKEIFPQASGQARLKQSYINSYLSNYLLALKKEVKVLTDFPEIKNKKEEDVVLQMDNISLTKSDMGSIMGKLMSYRYPDKKGNLKLSDVDDNELKNYMEYFQKIYLTLHDAKKKGEFKAQEMEQFMRGEKRKFLARFFFEQISQKITPVTEKEIEGEYQRRYMQRLRDIKDAKARAQAKASIPPLAKVRDSIQSQLGRNSKNRVIQTWINDQLKKSNFKLLTNNFKVKELNKPSPKQPSPKQPRPKGH
jgi:hypothetical protein